MNVDAMSNIHRELIKTHQMSDTGVLQSQKYYLLSLKSRKLIIC